MPGGALLRQLASASHCKGAYMLPAETGLPALHCGWQQCLLAEPLQVASQHMLMLVLARTRDPSQAYSQALRHGSGAISHKSHAGQGLHALEVGRLILSEPC